jgi:hypothetical protein
MRLVGWTTNYDPVAQNRVIVPSRSHNVLLPCGNYYFSVATEYYNTNADAARTTFSFCHGMTFIVHGLVTGLSRSRANITTHEQQVTRMLGKVRQ